MNSTHVLVGLELSPSDTHVLDTALLLAKDLGGGVHAIHAIDLGEDLPPEVAASPAARALQHKVEERVAHARAELDKVLERHATFGVPLKVTLERGRPYEALVAATASAEGECLLVVGSGRMQGGMMERLMGSTADQLLRHASCPVLVVPHRAGDEAHGGGATRAQHHGTWLVAVDGSEPCERALMLAARWAERMNATLSLVHASSDTQSRKVMREWIAAHESPAVRSLAADLAVIEDAPFAAITGQASAIGASMIVIGSHGRKGLARAFLGSVAASVVRHASVPVLCVR
jgi:nucleotide-binding universal stress UspA family protein